MATFFENIQLVAKTILSYLEVFWMLFVNIPLFGALVVVGIAVIILVCMPRLTAEQEAIWLMHQNDKEKK